MNQDDRDKLIEIHTIVKDIAPLVRKHDADIHKGKGIIAFIITVLGILGIHK
jgi:hypothetical protein